MKVVGLNEKENQWQICSMILNGKDLRTVSVSNEIDMS